MDNQKTRFQKECVRKLTRYPRKPCAMGVVVTQRGRAPIPPKCEWGVQSEDHCNCFWKYVDRKSDAEGYMPEHSHSDISKLFGWSTAKGHFIMHQANEALQEVMQDYET